jgi:lycopene cyclase domain-containing protein
VVKTTKVNEPNTRLKPTTPFLSWLKWGIPLLAFATVGVQWLWEPVQSGILLEEVPRSGQLDFLESRWTYFYLHLFTFFPVFFLSFDKNVHYYKKWKYLLPGILLVGGFFILWDVFFTWREVWGFNERYFAGLRFAYLPLEEWLFFFTVPFACVFIYECLNFYLKKDILLPLEPVLTPLLISLFLIVGFLFWGRLYTSSTFLWSGFFLLYHQLFIPQGKHYRSRFYLAFLVSLVPFLLVNGVLTGGYTDAPVVIYNPEEYLGVRIGSVPLDDSIYSFLLLLGVVTFFEKYRRS